MSRYYLAFCLVPLLAQLMGCAGVSTFQTARTLDPKQGRMTLGGSYLLGSSTNRPQGVCSYVTSSGEIPLIETFFRTAVVEDWDFGFKLTLPGTLAGDIKYQFVNDKLWAAAAGFGLGYVALSTTAISENKGIRSHFFDVSFPLYVGADISRNFGIYFSPRFIYRKDISSATPAAALVAPTLGARLGDTGGVMLEISYVTDLSTKANMTQVGVGIFFGTATSVPHMKREAPISAEKPVLNTEGQVLRFYHDRNLILVSHPNAGMWRITDRVCVSRNGTRIACGTITQLKPEYATVKLNFLRQLIQKGDHVSIDSRPAPTAPGRPPQIEKRYRRAKP